MKNSDAYEADCDDIRADMRRAKYVESVNKRHPSPQDPEHIEEKTDDDE